MVEPRQLYRYRFKLAADTWSAVAPRGQVWLFDVVGGFTVSPTGLSRPDIAWRALGRAAAAHTAYPELPLVLATPDPARPAGPAASALTGWAGARKPVRAVIDLNRLEQPGRAARPGTPPLTPMEYGDATLGWLSSVSPVAAGVAVGMDLPLWEGGLNRPRVAVTDRANGDLSGPRRDSNWSSRWHPARRLGDAR